MPYIDARRETLRLVGDYILTGNDQRRLGVLVLVGGGGRADRPVYAGRRPGAASLDGELEMSLAEPIRSRRFYRLRVSGKAH